MTPTRSIPHSPRLRLLAGAAALSLGWVLASPARASQTAETSNERKARVLKEIDERVRNSTAILLGEKNVEALRKELAELPQQAPSIRFFQVREKIVEYLLFYGELEEALKEVTALERFVEQRRMDPEYLVRAWMKRAVLHMREGERINCFTRHNEESCIFPLSPRAVHEDRQGASAAIEVLERILQMRPDHRQAVWMLNVAHMAVGTYPDGIPVMHRIPPEAFDSEFDIGHFRNIAAEAGLNTFNLAGGAAMDDFDGDGLLDVLTSSSKGDQPLCLKRNRGDGTFEDVTEKAGLLGQTGGLNLVHTDYDNDGRLDVLVLRGAWMKEWGEIPNSLLKQLPDGTFLDVTLEAGIEIAAPTQTAAFADVDLDGRLDLFIGYETNHTPLGPNYLSKLYRNRGDGTFEDMTERAGVANGGYCKGSTFGDYDNDGDPDLYVTNLDMGNRLYRNEGDWKFTDVAQELGVHAPLNSFATWFFDYNNDGWLDIWVNYYGIPRTDQIVGYYKNGAAGLDVSRLYENDGKGGFRDVTRERVLDRAHFTMGCSFGDLDNDGYSDVYLGTGDPDLSSLWPNILLRNDRGQRFQDVTKSGGFGVLQKGHNVAFGDIDADGDQDVFAEIGGATKDDGFWNVFFLNPGHGHRWITLRLEGVQTNRCAVGARIRVRIDEDGVQRDVHGTVGGVSSFGGNSLQQELGLGDADSIVELEITWPVSRTVQKFREMPLDSVLHVREGDADFQVLDHRRISLGE